MLSGFNGSVITISNSNPRSVPERRRVRRGSQTAPGHRSVMGGRGCESERVRDFKKHGERENRVIGEDRQSWWPALGSPWTAWRPRGGRPWSALAAARPNGIVLWIKGLCWGRGEGRGQEERGGCKKTPLTLVGLVRALAEHYRRARLKRSTSQTLSRSLLKYSSLE